MTRRTLRKNSILVLLGTSPTPYEYYVHIIKVASYYFLLIVMTALLITLH